MSNTECIDSFLEIIFSQNIFLINLSFCDVIAMKGEREYEKALTHEMNEKNV